MFCLIINFLDLEYVLSYESCYKNQIYREIFVKYLILLLLRHFVVLLKHVLSFKIIGV